LGRTSGNSEAMIITKQQLAVNLLNYLQHKTNLTELVKWAEDALMEGDIQDENPEVVRDILARLGLADVKSFGLFWEDCNEIMQKLGYVLKVDAGLVA
jgi:hypothetical protein